MSERERKREAEERESSIDFVLCVSHLFVTGKNVNFCNNSPSE